MSTIHNSAAAGCVTLRQASQSAPALRREAIGFQLSHGYDGPTNPYSQPHSGDGPNDGYKPTKTYDGPGQGYDGRGAAPVSQGSPGRVRGEPASTRVRSLSRSRNASVDSSNTNGAEQLRRLKSEEKPE